VALSLRFYARKHIDCRSTDLLEWFSHNDNSPVVVVVRPSHCCQGFGWAALLIEYAEDAECCTERNHTQHR